MSTLEALTREMIVDEARTWIGTSYHHGACVRGRGVDCGRLVEGVYRAFGVPVRMYDAPYAHDWHLHHTEERLLSYVQEHCDIIPEAALRPADIILWQYARAHAHAGIYVGDGYIIHADLDARTTHISEIDGGSRAGRHRICLAFRGFLQ